jgi:hypothetical protein
MLNKANATKNKINEIINNWEERREAYKDNNEKKMTPSFLNLYY